MKKRESQYFVEPIVCSLEDSENFISSLNTTLQYLNLIYKVVYLINAWIYYIFRQWNNILDMNIPTYPGIE